MSEAIEVSVTYGEKVPGDAAYSSREFRATLTRTVEVDGPDDAEARVAGMFDLLRAEVEKQKGGLL